MIVNRKINQAIMRLMKWSQKPQWVDYLDQTYFSHLDFALAELGISQHELVDYLNPDSIDLLNCAIFESFFTDRFGENLNLSVIDDFLKRRGKREPLLVRQYLRSLQDASVSIYEIIDLDPEGHTVKIRDLLQGDITLTVQRISDENDWATWDCLGARVVTMNGKHYFSGGTMPLSRPSANSVITSVNIVANRLKKRIIDRAKATNRESSELTSIPQDLFCAAAPIAAMITDSWLLENVSLARVPLPDFNNTHNEKIVMCEVVFPILHDSDDVATILDGIKEFERTDEEAQWNWHELGSPRKGAAESKKAIQVDEYSNDNVVLGLIEVLSDSLVVYVNSVERAEMAIKLLETRLGDLVAQPLISYGDLKQALKERIDSIDKKRQIKDKGSLEYQGTFLGQHNSRILDEAVPMPGNKIAKKAITAQKGETR